MPIKVDFSGLRRAAQQMGAAPSKFAVVPSSERISPLTEKLDKGIELLDLEDIDVSNGLISYEGHQILLYIPDHGTRVMVAKDDGSKGNKFHVADCAKLKAMRSQNRFDRYIAVNNLTGTFDIHGVHPLYSKKITGKTDLKVCKQCLRHLRYKGYSGKQSKRIFDNFSLKEFFETYSSFFPHKPKAFLAKTSTQNNSDWANVYGELKAEKDFTCDSCNVRLDKNRELLHVHHINGKPDDFRIENLKLVCSTCMLAEKRHRPTFVTRDERKTLNRSRKAQRISMRSGWKEAFEFADPALFSILQLCEAESSPVPVVGLDIQNRREEVVGTLDLAWPRKKMAIVIDQEELEAARKQKWEAWTMNEVLEDSETFLWNLNL